MNRRRHTVARTLSLVLLVLVVGLSAAAYGAVEPGPAEWLLFGSMLAAAPMFWSLSSVGRSPALRLAVPLFLVVVWGVVQSMPLPTAIVRVLSPAAAEVYERTVPPGGGESLPSWLLERARSGGIRVGGDLELPEGVPDRGDPATGRSLSLHPAATRDASFAWLGPILLLLTAGWVSLDPTCRYRLLWGLVAWGGIWGLVAILHESGWDGSPIWTRSVSPQELERMSRPFVNPNHYSLSVAMGALVAIGLLLALLSRASGALDRRGIRQTFADRAWTLPRVIGCSLAAGLALTGLALSRSRGGALALGCGLVFLVAARWLRNWLALAVPAVVLVGVLVGIPALRQADRASFATAPFVSAGGDSSALLRMDAWGKTLRMFLDHPVTGTGIGTFEWAFTGYQRQGEWMIFRAAHNDFLQLLAEGGLVAAVLLGWALWIFVARLLTPALRGVAGSPRWTTIGAAAAVFAVLTHSILDFNLQIPANAAQFAVLVGIVAAASRDDEAARPSGESS